MLLLITNYRIILNIDVIGALNNLDYEWIIKEFDNKKLQNQQYFKNYAEHKKSQDQLWTKGINPTH